MNKWVSEVGKKSSYETENMDKVVWTKEVDLVGRKIKVAAGYSIDVGGQRIHCSVKANTETPGEQTQATGLYLYSSSEDVPKIRWGEDLEFKKRYEKLGYEVFDTQEEAEKFARSWLEGLER